MCGISVIVALKQHDDLNVARWPRKATGPLAKLRSAIYHQEEEHLSDRLEQSLAQLSHRGPDSRAHWISEDGRVGFGHVRLSINDLSPNGSQPFHDTAGSVHVVVNGELYNVNSIREEMTKKTGYVFQGRSDCEIVLPLYKYYGPSFLQYLRGEFSLCLYDSETKFFMAARDRYGIKPLFWTMLDGRLVLASEAKAFIPFDWQPEWDVKCLMDDGWRHDQRTPFRGVNKIRPGYYLTCNSSGSVDIQQYWDLDFPDKTYVDHRTEQEVIDGVRSRLVESVRERLQADVPIGIYLSGGLDSSAVAGIACHLIRKNGALNGHSTKQDGLTCFSIEFDESSGMDESGKPMHQLLIEDRSTLLLIFTGGIAERTAHHLGVPLIRKKMNEEEIAKRFEDAVWHCEHQNYDLNFVGKFALSEAPQELGVKVVLTGEGADEVFGGYPAFLPDLLRETDHSRTPLALSEKERVGALVTTEAQAAQYYARRALSTIHLEDSLARRQLNNISSMVWLAGYVFPMFSRWTECYGKSDACLTIASNINNRVKNLMLNKWHPLNSALYMWAKGNLANVLLSCLGDRSEMAHGIQGRLPFLDHKLTEYVNQIPPSLKIKAKKGGGFIEKWVLREAVKPFITDEIYGRKKHGYAAPTRWKTNGPLHRLFQRLITQQNVERLGFLEWSMVENIVHCAFVKHEITALRQANVVAQWVVLAQRFGIKTATP